MRCSYTLDDAFTLLLSCSPAISTLQFSCFSVLQGRRRERLRVSCKFGVARKLSEACIFELTVDKGVIVIAPSNHWAFLGLAKHVLRSIIHSALH